MEKDISTGIIAMVNQIPHCEAVKRLSNGSTSTNGYPDITGVVGIHFMTPADQVLIGVHLEIETKQPGEKPSGLQYARLRKYRKAGCISFWTDSVQNAQDQLDLWINVLEGRKKHPGFSDLINKRTVILKDMAA